MFAVIPTTVTTLEKSELYDVIVERAPVGIVVPGGLVVPGGGSFVWPGVAVPVGWLDGVLEDCDVVGVGVPGGLFTFGGRSVGGGRPGLPVPEGVSACHSTPPGPIS